MQSPHSPLPSPPCSARSAPAAFPKARTASSHDSPSLSPPPPYHVHHMGPSAVQLDERDLPEACINGTNCLLGISNSTFGHIARGRYGVRLCAGPGPRIALPSRDPRGTGRAGDAKPNHSNVIQGRGVGTEAWRCT